MARAAALPALFLLCIAVGTSQSPCKPHTDFSKDPPVVVDCHGNAIASDDGAQAGPPDRLSAAQADYDVAALRNRHDVFEWQYISTIVIFIVTVGLVVAGVGFSGWQLWHGMKMGERRMAMIEAAAKKLADAPSLPPDSDAETSLKVSSTGLEVHSATLGVIILAISMCFFFLYIKYVYPVRVVAWDHPSAQTSGRPAKDR
jgi:hypothetical protein